MAMIRLAGVVQESIVDGPGIRYTIFTQGCPHHCPGCHNPESHDPVGGYERDTKELLAEFQKNPLLKGMTFSGGDPFLQAAPLSQLAEAVHALGKDVLVYTGYTMEYLLAHLDEQPGWRELLEQTDVLIDGPFIQKQKSLGLRFRGSANQRYIDARASLREGRVIETSL